MITLYLGDCLEIMKGFAADSIDAVVCDPPYGISFMSAKWDRGIPGVPYWQECLRTLKPGGHLVAMGGSRTSHRLTCVIEDAGFEIRDSLRYYYDSDPMLQAFFDSLTEEQQELLLRAWPSEGALAWVQGQGFPKSLDVSKALDEAAGAVREVIGVKTVATYADSDGVAHYANRGKSEGSQVATSGAPVITAPATDLAKRFAGFGTALKPAFEPAVLARKPLIGTVAQNVTQYGTGGLNIDGCRVPVAVADAKAMERCNTPGSGQFNRDGAGGLQGTGTFARSSPSAPIDTTQGRWPANVVHDGSEAVVAVFPETKTDFARGQNASPGKNSVYSAFGGVKGEEARGYELPGGMVTAARFFYCAKTSKKERQGTKHPTAKPLALMEWLVKLVTPSRGTVLDPFMGSGSTLVAAQKLGFDAIGIDIEEQYYRDTAKRLGKHLWQENPDDPEGWLCTACKLTDQHECAAAPCDPSSFIPVNIKEGK